MAIVRRWLEGRTGPKSTGFQPKPLLTTVIDIVRLFAYIWVPTLLLPPGALHRSSSDPPGPHLAFRRTPCQANSFLVSSASFSFGLSAGLSCIAQTGTPLSDLAYGQAYRHQPAMSVRVGMEVTF